MCFGYFDGLKKKQKKEFWINLVWLPSMAPCFSLLCVYLSLCWRVQCLCMCSWAPCLDDMSLSIPFSLMLNDYYYFLSGLYLLNPFILYLFISQKDKDGGLRARLWHDPPKHTRPKPYIVMDFRTELIHKKNISLQYDPIYRVILC